ncbi:MAG TPA: hypothetical protein VG893_15780 [Terracidiphilus sp.]|nr:hypothetical protein [Terracidiphilus sp.]
MKANFKNMSGTKDDEMRPEYDFTQGVRNIHAYRFSKLSSDEALILGYWQGKGFTVTGFSKRELRDMKTPDFLLARNGQEIALCEVKSYQRDAWLEEQMKQVAPGELAGGLRNDPIYNRISHSIHTAVQQFSSVNADHSRLNFLVLVNHDTSARYKDLVSVLTGYWDPLGGDFDRTHLQFSEGRIREDKKQIDLCVWLEIRKDGTLGRDHLFFPNPDTRVEVCGILDIDPEKVRDIPPAA